ncbi:wax ester/triacylglycerol synthase family O-acyltransferase [Nocardioides agariphilus]|jgi:diacylglycerol O-acyltransferase|uniref:Diacylglycerol O-acyltransferase n=1 Tax=Nocardioides agariphilus TaxID=433664 RepID=A0A930VKP8_9ACTN|nr:wax ester/triacylglycerol synthase family O-acyltransferase [Nocardioides agariphilus]MBF4766490.1 wax ester/triacylglycerol synthase family O-acyltransferase [Nocardioides agariphilus]
MTERLRPRDIGVLAVESASAPRHNATVEIFDPAGSGFDYARLVELVGDRISFVPRYRQRIAKVPGGLANPVWVDDPDFDLGYHVRRSALPRPGSCEQLFELVARIVSRPLDRHRPLWEAYFIEGLEHGRVAVLSKSHEVLVDGVHTVDLAQVLLDRTPDPRPMHHDDWRPLSAPSPMGLVAGAINDAVSGPVTALDAARSRLDTVVRSADSILGQAASVIGALGGGRPAGEHPLGGPLSQQRRVVTVRTDLQDYLDIRKEHGGDVHDVILATIAGALRGWLLGRSESMSGVRHVRTVVPVSVSDRDLETTSLGSPIVAYFVDLPVGESSPVVRLHQVSYAFKAHKETGRGVAANRLAGIAGFAPSTFHAIGARVAGDEVRRGFQLSVTNVPGPQSPLYAAGARMLETYPVHPLLPGHALAIGVTSYDGRVFYGITADRDRIHDADVLGQCVSDALAELLDTIGGRARAPRGRVKKAVKRATSKKTR